MKEIHNLPEKKTLRRKLRHDATPAEKVSPPTRSWAVHSGLLLSGAQAGYRDSRWPAHDVLRREYDAERRAYLESQDPGAVFREPRTAGTVGVCDGRHLICGA